MIDAVVTYKTICDTQCIVANQRLKCCGYQVFSMLFGRKQAGHSIRYSFNASTCENNNNAFSVTRKKSNQRCSYDDDDEMN